MLIQDGYDINGRSPTATAEYFKYDASGNVWYDRHAKTSYKLNAAGLPEVAYIQNEYDADLTLSSVNSGSVDDLSATMYMTYDESGQRIWTRVKTQDMDYGEATLPGVGVYSADFQAQTGYTLKRMDLIAGGYREMSIGKAYFPITDAQGNVRGYASDEGLVSAYDYYAYGGVKTITEEANGWENIEDNTTDDNKRWVFIRETLMQLKWQSFIEKDILRRSGCEAAFLLRSNRDSAQGKEYDKPIQKHYFGARYFDPFFGLWMSPDPAGQFANPYTYGGDPINYVDPNGEAVHILVGAIIGAVVGTVNGAIQCTSAGGGSCGKSVGVGFVGGATAVLGTGSAATVGSAVVGGAVAGAGNYATQSIVNGGFNSGDLWESTWKGAAAGAVGGAAGSWGSGAFSSMTGGFAGGATGSALNGGDGWDALKGGLMGSGMALASYAMVWGYNNHIRPGDLSKDNVEYAEKNDKSVPTKEAGSFKGDEFEILAAEDFKKWHASAAWKNSEGESGVTYRRNTSFWTEKKSVTRIPETAKHIEGTSIKLNANADFIFHSHPNNPFPSGSDYSSAQISYNKYGGQSYLLAPNNTDVFWISPAKEQFLKMEY